MSKLSPRAAQDTPRARLTIEIDPSAVTFTASPPDMVSQKTVLQVCGIPPRIYLEAVRAPGFPLAVIRLGRLRLVDRGAFLTWLRAQPAAGPANDQAPDENATLDELLDELDLEVAPKARRGSR